MKVNKKLVTLLSIVMVLALALSACSGNSGGEGSSNTPAPSGSSGQAGSNDQTEKVELTIWTGWADLDPWFNEQIEAYKSVNPNVEITVSSFPLREYEQKIAAALPSGGAADILPVNPSLAVRYIQNGFLREAPQEIVDLALSNSYAEIMRENAQYDGTVYGIPALMGAGAVFYNIDMLEEAGLTKPPSEVEEFLDYARKLAKYDDDGNLVRAGMSLRLSGGGSGVGEKFWNILAQRGGTIIEEVEPGKYRAAYNTEDGYETLKMYVDMVHKYNTDDPTILHDTEAFQKGVAAFYIRESNIIPNTAQVAPDLNYGAAPLRANVISLINYYVSSKDDAKAQAAWDFINFIVQPEPQAAMIESSGWLSARNDLDLSELYEKFPQYEAFFVDQEYQMYPAIGEFDEILTKFADRLATRGFTDPSFVDNEEKIKAFLDEAAQETNEILRRAGILAE